MPGIVYVLDRAVTKAKLREIIVDKPKRIMAAILAQPEDRITEDLAKEIMRKSGLNLFKKGGGTAEPLSVFDGYWYRCFQPLGMMKREGYSPSPRGSKGAEIDEAKIIELVKKHAPAAGAGVDVVALTADIKTETTRVAAAIKEQVRRDFDSFMVASHAQLQKAVDEKISALTSFLPTRVEIKKEGKEEVKNLGLQHRQFPTLVKALSTRITSGGRLNVWMTGPAGSGKTTAALNAALALDLKFYFTGAIDNQYALLGFVDAKGHVVRTQFREAYENGGVFLFDEVDASAPGAVLAFNAALAGNHCSFPDVVVDRHKDFVCVAAANTWGLGATTDYVGRMKMDAAFIDRFAQIDWTTDEALELATAGDAEWTKFVQAVRTNVKSRGIKVIVSPRASYYGAALLKAGLEREEVIRMTLRKAMTDAQWESVKPQTSVGTSSATGSQAINSIP